MKHPLSGVFTHWTDKELFLAQEICEREEGHDCFLFINLNKKMTYLQIARIRTQEKK